VTLLASLCVGSLVVYVVILLARFIDAVLWCRQLVAFHLELRRQLTHDQQRPAVADHVERFGDRAVLVVGPHRTSDSISLLFF